MSIEALIGGMAVLSGLDFGFGQANSATSYKYQQKLAAQNYHYQSQLLKKQQDWTERMSNTAHQREVTDLREAGLNPILSATGGSGASSPVVSAPGFSTPSFNASSSNIASNSAKAVSDLQRAFDTELKKTDSEIRNSNKVADATVKKLNAEAKNLDAQAYRTKHRVQLPLGGEIPAGAADALKNWSSWPGRGLELYLDHVGRPFSEWMNNSAKSVGDFFGSMRKSPSRGRDMISQGRVVEYKGDRKKPIFHVKYDTKGWKR